MPFLIDGHNLIGQLPDISLDDPNDEARLVIKLRGFAARTGKKCVVVFDTGLPGGTSPMSNSRVEVIFASHRENADRVILQRIGKTRDARNWIVVSSDHAVQDAARRKGMSVVSSAAFVSQLQSPAEQRPEDDKPPGNRPMSADEMDEWLRLFGGSE